MPRPAEWRRIKADPARLARFYANRAEKHNARARAWKAANPEKVAAGKRRWRAANPQKVAQQKARHYAKVELARLARREVEAEIAAANRCRRDLSQSEQIAVYRRALSILPPQVPSDARLSYAAAALIAVMDGDLRLDFDLGDLREIRREDFALDTSPRLVSLDDGFTQRLLT